MTAGDVSVPSPILLPYTSPDPWKRRLHDTIAQMSTATAVAIGLLGITIAGWVDISMDRMFQYDVAQTSIYILPVGFVAWACGLPFGIPAALVAALLEGWVNATSSRQPGLGVLSIEFLLKSVTLITGALLMARLRYLLEEEKALSRTDPLTGIANNRAFWNSMELEVERMKRDGKPLSVLFIDIDDFKQVNDTLGHKGGDALLKVVGQALSDVTRAVDSIARIGGDEFAVLLPNADTVAGVTVVRRLLATLRARICHGTVKPTLSIGLATFVTPPDTVEALLHASDMLMYEAKTLGKNRVASRVY
jgi:diguanylate cyclase (GGDEF)-like protein